MTQKANPKIPDISLASEPWVKEQLMDTENRIEKAFHQQTKYLQQNIASFSAELHQTNTSLSAEMHRNNLQVILAILGVGAAIVVALFLK